MAKKMVETSVVKYVTQKSSSTKLQLFLHFIFLKNKLIRKGFNVF